MFWNMFHELEGCEIFVSSDIIFLNLKKSKIHWFPPLEFKYLLVSFLYSNRISAGIGLFVEQRRFLNI